MEKLYQQEYSVGAEAGKVKRHFPGEQVRGHLGAEDQGTTFEA